MNTSPETDMVPVRDGYAEGSVEPDAGTVYRRKPSDTADAVDGALGLPDFTGFAERHRLDKIDLPAIGDGGVGHTAFYRGESVTLAGYEDVFTKREDGTWRRLVFKGYMPDRAGGGRLSRQSRWNATRPSTPCGRMRSRTASPRQRTNDGSGRRCGLLPEPAHVPDGRCA